MIVFVGLGNPGDEYYNTKHNAGYWIVDELAKRWVCDFTPGKDNYVFSEKKTKGVMLIKPTTGMNNSGIALKHFVRFFNINLNNLFVCVDDVDLPLGRIRIRPKGGDGCHRGLESIIYHLGNTNFPRLRIGVASRDYKRPSEKYVLKPFKSKDQNFSKEMIQVAADAAESLLYSGLDKTMNKYNKLEMG
jgi:PTH1 family peptidyl-tRNA hydrolase